MAAALLAPGAGAFYAMNLEPFWPEFSSVRMPIANLPPVFEGLRIAHLTDLHISGRASDGLVKGIVREVNRLRPDVVVITGDLVSAREGWLDEACATIAQLGAPAVLVSLGNHDYGIQVYKGKAVETSEELQKRLVAARVQVLRNAAWPLEVQGQRLWFAGFEDLWSGRFSPDAGLGKVTSPGPIIALSHNPDTALALDNYGVSCTLSGHTHGGQLRLPGYGALMLPVQHREFQCGLYELPRSRLYVSRGIGYLMRARFACRPEVAMIELVAQQ